MKQSSSAGFAEAAFTALSGVVFGIGLGVSGMARPVKVIGFLDVSGAWDASLAFVMLGAVAVHAIAYRLILRRRAPLCAAEFAIPARRTVDGRLIVGAALFGVGWGLAGYCPGPAIVGLGAGMSSALWFVVTALAAFVATAKLEGSTSS